MKHINLLQEYLSNLAVMNVKLHNIHWNVVGEKFVQIHNFTEEIYDELFENYDEVAEALKMKGILPLSTMKEYLENASIKEIPAKSFSMKESLDIVKSDLEEMKKLATDIRNIADEEGDFEVVGIFEDYVGSFSKNIWFLNAIMG